MANIKISQLTPKGANLASTDLLEISEVSGGGYVTKSVTGTEIRAGLQPTLVSGTNIKTINSTSLLGSGNINTASVNPTSGRIPFNSSGVFANSSLSIGSVSGFPSLTANYSVFEVTDPLDFNSTRLSLDALNSYYSIGQASASSGGVSAFKGAAFGFFEFILNSQYGTNGDGLIKCSGFTGDMLIGNGPSRSIGASDYNDAMHVGTSMISTGSTTSITRWLKVITEGGTTYRIPLYT